VTEGLSSIHSLAMYQDGAFTRRQASEQGVSRKVLGRRLRDGELTELVPGVLVVAGSPPTWRQQIRVATLARGGTVASHRAACRLHALDGFDDAPVEVLIARPRLAVVENVVVHRSVRFEPIDLTTVDGIPVTTIARTLCDLGAVVNHDRVEQALDSAQRMGVSEQWIRLTLKRLERPGPSGTPVLRDVLNDPRRQGKVPDSWFERLISRMVSTPEFPPLERRHVVRDRHGQVIGEIDVALPLVKVGIEGHSDLWHYGPRRGRKDHRRDRRFKAEGWEMVYLSWDDTQKDMTDALADIKAIVDLRARLLGVTLPTGI
jgi:hypothetical protein